MWLWTLQRTISIAHLWKWKSKVAAYINSKQSSFIALCLPKKPTLCHADLSKKHDPISKMHTLNIKHSQCSAWKLLMSTPWEHDTKVFCYTMWLWVRYYLKLQHNNWQIRGNSIQAVGKTVVERAKKLPASQHPQSHYQHFPQKVKNVLLQVTVHVTELLTKPKIGRQLLIEKQRWRHKTFMTLC